MAAPRGKGALHDTPAWVGGQLSEIIRRYIANQEEDRWE
jgi:hypothetical protein